MSASVEQIIKKLDLAPLEGEGGYFRNTYRTAHGSAIYYLVTPNDFSALHRLKHDEIFHFYSGDPVEMIQINPQGDLKKITLGSDFLNGMEPQSIVTAGIWQGARLKPGGQWALLGTTMTPRFEYSEFELGSQAELQKQFPQHGEIINRYTRTTG